jgi:hypothetical protein
MFVKPAAGLRVRDPVKKDFLPDEGREVADSLYWQRRILDKDVELVKPSAAALATKKNDSAGGEA